VHDFRDTAMMEALRPSIEEALPINSQDLALDYIGKRGSSVGVTRAKRLEYARDILQKEMLPHVGIAPGCETKKARAMVVDAVVRPKVAGSPCHVLSLYLKSHTLYEHCVGANWQHIDVSMQLSLYSRQ